MATIVDKVMNALEFASQSVPMKKEGWATLVDVQAFANEANLKPIQITPTHLNSLVSEGRAETKIITINKHPLFNARVWRPLGGGGAGGGAGSSGNTAEDYLRSPEDGYRSPEGGYRSPDPYDSDPGPRSPDPYSSDPNGGVLAAGGAAAGMGAAASGTGAAAGASVGGIVRNVM